MKRTFDILVSLTLLIALSPLLTVIALLVCLKLGKPVLFRQLRPGLETKPFEMLKFRSMTDFKDPNGALLPDAERLTPFGRLLRSSSLDELPSLINVLRGEMSLVGPRPLLMQYVALYDDFQFRRHEVRPGITGLAQINGRNTLDWDKRFALDIWYIDNRSFILDLRILWLSAVKVLRRDGVTAVGEATMPVFRGNGGTK